MFPEEMEEKRVEEREWRHLASDYWLSVGFLGHTFWALVWNLPSLAAVLVDGTHKNNFLTIAQSPEGMITLLYFWNSSLVILKKVHFFPCLDSPKAQRDNNPFTPNQAPHLQTNGDRGHCTSSPAMTAVHITAPRPSPRLSHHMSEDRWLKRSPKGEFELENSGLKRHMGLLAQNFLVFNVQSWEDTLVDLDAGGLRQGCDSMFFFSNL